MTENDRPDPAGADGLLHRLALARHEARQDPFRNPVLGVALDLIGRVQDGRLDAASARSLVSDLGRAAVADRAERLAGYVGLPAPEPFDALAAGMATGQDDAASYADAIGRRRFGAVFTAHPTFGMTRDLAGRLATLAGGGEAPLDPALTFRPDPDITLDDEYAQAREAVVHARNAIDRLNAALLREGRARFPDEWTAFVPSTLALGSWVGCDTDGRTDIDWPDTLRYRLRSKHGQLSRLVATLPADPVADEVRALAQRALDTVTRQLDGAPALGAQPDMDAIRDFALSLVEGRDAALTHVDALLEPLDAAIRRATDDETRLQLLVVKAGLWAHGLSIALPHVRLNAAQLHNALRRLVTLDGDPLEPSQRRGYLAAINKGLASVAPVPVDFGSLAAERSSAARLVMSIAQLVKHVDGSRPVRFLIAETETGYTLLAALWLATRYGVADHVEITPLFETAEALEQGPRIVDEALRSEHWRAYLRRQGRFVVQFGYSDSGRYVGQLAATFLVERLRRAIAEALVHHGLTDVELVIFDTHGESVGRGAHPDSLRDRLAYLAPPQAWAEFAQAGIRVGRETSFQGTDGYLLFGSDALAGATIARIAEHVLAGPATEPDPVYAEPDFATAFFGTLRLEMEALVDDPGYAALIGTFGPALLDKTGSRPAARQSEGGGPARISHPRELRAIPNNAILQQLGWMANSLHGLGRASARAPDLVGRMRAESDRFGRAFRLAEGAMRGSDLDVLRAYTDTLDPSSWFDRARRADTPAGRDELVAVANALARLDLSPQLRRLFGRLTRDWLDLAGTAPDLPAMSPRLAALHALRVCAIHRIWILAAHIPEFRPQDGITRDLLLQRILRLDVPAALDILTALFPLHPDASEGVDFGEPPGPRETGTYAGLHDAFFTPMRAWFDVVREISGAIQHEIGAFG